MKTISNIAMIIFSLIAILKYAIDKNLSPENVGALLILNIIFIAGGKSFVKLIAAISALASFSYELAGNNPDAAPIIFKMFIILTIGLIGIYLMVKPFFPKK